MFTKLWASLIAAGGVVLALLGALWSAKRSGKKEAQLEQAQNSLKQVKEANEIDLKVSKSSRADIDKRMSKYKRD